MESMCEIDSSGPDISIYLILLLNLGVIQPVAVMV